MIDDAKKAELREARKLVAEAKAAFLRAAEMGANLVNLHDVRALMDALDAALPPEKGGE